MPHCSQFTPSVSASNCMAATQSHEGGFRGLGFKGLGFRAQGFKGTCVTPLGADCINCSQQLHGIRNKKHIMISVQHVLLNNRRILRA